jgi:hypothetical protein
MAKPRFQRISISSLLSNPFKRDLHTTSPTAVEDPQRPSGSPALSKGSRLLTLPPELRDEVFRYVLLSSTPIALRPPLKTWLPGARPADQGSSAVAKTAHVLFLVCRLVYEEASHIFYVENIFFFTPATISRSIESTFGTGLLYNNLRRIRHWHIDVELNNYTYRDNLYGSLSLQSFWEKRSERDVVVEVHLRLPSSSRLVSNTTSVEVERWVDGSVGWWRDAIVRRDFALKIFLHGISGLTGMWGVMAVEERGFKPVSCLDGWGHLAELGAARLVSDWVLEEGKEGKI